MKKIFLKDACPVAMGGQAVIEGIMMKNAENTAVAVRLPNGEIHIKKEKNKKLGKLTKLPIFRGIIAFLYSLISGTKMLMYSANVQEEYEREHGTLEEEQKGFEKWILEKFGEKRAWDIMVFLSVIISLLFSIGIFVLAPTVVVSFLKMWIKSALVLNLIEGIVRIIMLVIYILVISKMEDVKRLFQYHGAEHKCIHCFERGEELTPENCQEYYTLHTRCGTSFLVFVMVISILLFSLTGWPNLLARFLYRILLIPVVAGLSYEVLKLAGRSDGKLVKILSYPGLMFQKLTTKEPDLKQLEVAIAAVNAVMENK